MKNTKTILTFNYVNGWNTKELFKKEEEVKKIYIKNFLIPYHSKRVAKLNNSKRLNGFWKISLIEEKKYLNYLKSL